MTDREKLVYLLVNAFCYSDDNYGCPNTGQVADYLMANGVVTVVRCKDCKHFVQDAPYDPCECMKWTTKWGVAYTEPDGFCSYGERRSE